MDIETPAAHFDAPTKAAILAQQYPQLAAILAAKPDINSRELGKKLGVSHVKAQQIRRDWLAAQPAKPEEKPGIIAEIKQKITSASGGGKTLTSTEAEELREPFINALSDNFKYLDQYLWNRQRAAAPDPHELAEEPIWSDLDEEEIEKLCNVMFRFAAHNETAATVVRGVVDASDYIAVGAIFAPRIKRTVDVMRATRRPRSPRAQRIQHEN